MFMKPVQPRFNKDPIGDWQKLLTMALIAAIVIIGGAGFMFYKLTKGQLFTTSTAQMDEAQIFDKKNLKRTNEFYDAREKKFLELGGGLIDPV